MFLPDPDSDFLPIPDPGSRGQKGTGSRIRIHNTAGPHWNQCGLRIRYIVQNKAFEQYIKVIKSNFIE
jgi:hypothetical protein